MTGSGTLLDPYVIWDVNDLQAVRTYDAAYFELGADIDATATAGWYGGLGFEPLDWPYPQKRQPSGDFAAVGAWTVFPVAPATLWDKVDEVDQDGDASYIRIDALGGNVLFNIPNFAIPAGSTNIELHMEIWARIEGVPADADGKIYIRVNGANYQTGFWRTVGDELTYEYNHFINDRFSTNPDTGLAWTVDDINGVGANPLQAIGVNINAGKICRITKIVATVYCDPPVNLTFDGKGHSITGLTIDRVSQALGPGDIQNVGLFRYLDGGEIKNINLVNCDMSGRWDVGGIVSGSYWSSGGISNCNVSGTLWSELGGIGGISAWMGYAGGNITNCHVTADLTCLRGYVGGIASYAFEMSGIGSLDIRDCSYTGTITIGAGYDYNGGIVAYGQDYNLTSCTAEGVMTGGDDQIGGIVGYGTDMNLTDCESNMTIDGDKYVGGLVARSNGTGVILRCQANGNIVATGDYVGGLVGYSLWQISQSLATGNITGVDYVGGLVGYSNNGSIADAYATGNVTGNDRVGGLVGRQAGSTIDDSFSTGVVIGNTNVGGLAGQNSGVVSNSFWDVETSGQAASAAGTGKTTAEMKELDTFLSAGWDIEARTTDLNTGYPYLAWQSVWYIFVAAVPPPALVSVITLPATEIR